MIIHQFIQYYFMSIIYLDFNLRENNSEYSFFIINPLTSPGEGVTVFTSPYLNAGAPAFGEAKGLINVLKI